MPHTQRYRPYDRNAYRPLHPDPPLNKRWGNFIGSKGKGFRFADLVHSNLKPDDQLVLDYCPEDPAVGEKNHASNSGYLETGLATRVACTEPTKDDFVKKFLESLRPSLEMHTESFERLGIDSEASLKAFSKWNPWDRERWIMSQNVYLCLTPLDIGSFMLGVESLA